MCVIVIYITMDAGVKMKKKIFGFIFTILILTVVFSLVGCEFNRDDDVDDDLPITVKSLGFLPDLIFSISVSLTEK